MFSVVKSFMFLLPGRQQTKFYVFLNLNCNREEFKMRLIAAWDIFILCCSIALQFHA